MSGFKFLLLALPQREQCRVDVRLSQIFEVPRAKQEFACQSCSLVFLLTIPATKSDTLRANHRLTAFHVVPSDRYLLRLASSSSSSANFVSLSARDSVLSSCEAAVSKAFALSRSPVSGSPSGFGRFVGGVSGTQTSACSILASFSAAVARSAIRSASSSSDLLLK